MSNSVYLNLKGKAFWAQVFPENRDLTGYDDTLKDMGGQYTLAVALTEDSMADLVESKSQAVDNIKVIEDDEGNPHDVVRFKRPHEKYSRDTGELLEWASGAPKVFKSDGSPWSLEEDGLIGNTSEVEVRVCVYKAGRLYGTRLESVKVLDHVPAPEKEPS